MQAQNRQILDYFGFLRSLNQIDPVAGDRLAAQLDDDLCYEFRSARHDVDGGLEIHTTESVRTLADTAPQISVHRILQVEGDRSCRIDREKIVIDGYFDDIDRLGSSLFSFLTEQGFDRVAGDAAA